MTDDNEVLLFPMVTNHYKLTVGDGCVWEGSFGEGIKEKKEFWGKFFKNYIVWALETNSYFKKNANWGSICFFDKIAV